MWGYIGLLMDYVRSGGHLVMNCVGIRCCTRPKHLNQGFCGGGVTVTPRFVEIHIEKSNNTIKYTYVRVYWITNGLCEVMGSLGNELCGYSILYES